MCKQTLAIGTNSSKLEKEERPKTGEGKMEAEWEESTERENKLDHVFKSTTARETSIERSVWVGKHSTGREQTDVDEKQALHDVEKRKIQRDR